LRASTGSVEVSRVEPDGRMAVVGEVPRYVECGWKRR
jgi:hypothetical protein